MLLVGDKVRITSVPADCEDPVEAGLVCVIENARLTPDGVRYYLSYYGDSPSLSVHFFAYNDWAEDQLSSVQERYIPSLPAFQLGDKVIDGEDSTIYDITDIYLLHNGDAPIIGYGTRHDLTTNDTDEDWYGDDLYRLYRMEGTSCSE